MGSTTTRRDVQRLCTQLLDAYNRSGPFTIAAVDATVTDAMRYGSETNNEKAKHRQRHRFFRCVSKGYFAVVPGSTKETFYAPGPCYRDAFLHSKQQGQGQRFPVPVPDLCSFFGISLPDNFYKRRYPNARVHREPWE